MYNTIINENGINVFTVQHDMKTTVEIWAVEYQGGRPYANCIIKDHRLEMEKLSEEEIEGPMVDNERKPLMVIPRHFAIPLMKAMVEHLNQNGARTKEHNLIEGELNATRHHLGDLQVIVRKLIKID